MMQDAILATPKQFEYIPEVMQKASMGTYSSYIVLGMGGSHLAADILSEVHEKLDLRIHSDYRLPYVPAEKKESTLIIASSYSGNTEEVLEGTTLALKEGLPVAVVAVGGKLLEIAQEHHLPYVQLPDTGIQPRSALGFSLRGLLALMGERALLEESAQLRNMQPAVLEEKGKEIAENWKDKTPIIYASTKHKSIAYNWKIKMNETGKIPAFYNVLPEMNHNEMNGFDIKEKSKALAEKFTILMIKDKNDHPKVLKRMEVVEKLYADRGLSVMTMTLTGENELEKIFTSLTIADWVAVHIAALYDHEAEQVPMIEEFKKLIA